MGAIQRRLAVIIGMLLVTPAVSYSQTVTAVWDPNPSTEQITNYEVCLGTTSLSCNVTQVTVPGSQTSYVFSPAPGVLYRIAVRAISSTGTGNYSPEVSVSIPGFGTLANRTSTVNTAISPVTITASDPDGGTLTYTHTGLPFGLTLNQSTGVISGTPTTAGTYNVTIFANDGLVTTSGSFVWTIQSAASDTTAPTLTISSHTNNQTVTTANITLAGTASDSGAGGSGITSVMVNGAAATGGTASGSNTANWSRAVTLVAGANALTVVATDGAGNSRTSSITINLSTPDTAAPSVSITSHTNGQTVTASSITLAGTATDSGTGGSGITSVTVNGAAATGGTASGSNTANWSRALTLAVGSNVLTVVATDGAGNARTSSITITLANPDTTAPNLTITSHTNGQTVTTSSITLAGTATDSGTGGSGITRVTVNGTAATGGTASGSNTANWSRAVSLVAGANVLNVVATDGAGNSRSASITVTYAVPDTTAPSLTITSHTSGQTVNTSSITLAGTATDSGTGGSGIASVTVNGAAASGGTATGTGTANWSRVVSLSSGSNLLTVVATDTAGNARQSQITINRADVVSAVSASPNTGSGTSQTFALQYSDTAGATNLAQAWVWFNAALASTSSNSCLVYYNRAASTLNLLNDGSSWMPGTMGSGTTLQNSQCAVNLGASSVAVSGNVLTLNLAMTFTPAYAGTKNVYMYAANGGGVNSGWQARGSWSVPSGSLLPPPSTGAVTADSVAPTTGSGLSQTFALQYSDMAGASDFSSAWVWFNANLASTSNRSCLIQYNRATSAIALLDDNSSAWMPGAPGSGTTLQNSQCAVNLGASSVTMSGTTLTMTLAMTFKPLFSGSKNIYMFSAGTSANSGWQTRGAWLVPSGTGPTVTADSVTPNAGSGTTQTFALQYSDTAGATDLSTVWVWFNATFATTSSNSCLFFYQRSTGRLFLEDDAAAFWQSGALGSAGILQNSQCAVDLGASSVTQSGSTLILNLATTFKPTYTGTKNIYMFGQNGTGAISGWQLRGSWLAQ